MINRSLDQWQLIMYELEKLKDSALVDAYNETLNNKRDSCYTALKSRKTTDRDIHFNLGAISAHEYGIMIFDDIYRQARKSIGVIMKSKE